MDLAGLQAWLDRYVDAWRTNDPRAIGDLFTDDAVYYTHPWREPWRGRDEIVRGWSEDPDDPSSWECDYRAVAVSGEVGVGRGWTRYSDGAEYANVYLIRFADDLRAAEFTEFFMKRPAPAGGGSQQ